jgi:hypothetical protein
VSSFALCLLNEKNNHKNYLCTLQLEKQIIRGQSQDTSTYLKLHTSQADVLTEVHVDNNKNKLHSYIVGSQDPHYQNTGCCCP